MTRVPGIVADIDGVILLGDKAIPGVKEGLERVLTGVEIDSKRRDIPFSMLTNGGSYTERKRAEKMNAIIGLTKDMELTEN